MGIARRSLNFRKVITKNGQEVLIGVNAVMWAVNIPAPPPANVTEPDTARLTGSGGQGDTFTPIEGDTSRYYGPANAGVINRTGRRP